MNRSLTAFLLFITLLLAGGCVGSSPEPVPAPKVEKSIPSWYLNPPAGTATHLYGIGEGTSMDDATKHALSNMVGQLGISISSTYESTLKSQRSYREYYTKTTSEAIQSEIAKIRISNYELVESEQYRYNRFFVLVRSDRQKLQAALQNDLDKSYKEIAAKANYIGATDVLNQFRFYRESTETINNSLSTLLVLKSINPAFDDAHYLRQGEAVTSSFDTLKERMAFHVTSNQENRRFADVVRVALTDAKMRIVTQRNADAYTIRVDVSSTINFSHAHGFDIARVNLLVEAKEHKGKIVGGNRISLTGQATQGVDTALDNAAKKLQKQIKLEGVSKVLGIDID